MLLQTTSSPMAVHSVSSLSLDPFNFPQNRKLRRSTLCYNGNAFDIKDLNRLQTGTLKPTRRPSHLTSLTPCRVKNEESQGTLSEESIILDQETLERDLQIAIEEEDYGLAARIRDRLRILHEDSKASVLAANARFYNAFKKGDLAAMQALWAEGDHVCCVHPGVNGISGYDLVMSSWEYVLANYEFPLEIEVKDVIVHVKGDLGFVTCMEFIKTKGSSWGKQSVTNVFERIDGQWFICIHHASISNIET